MTDVCTKCGVEVRAAGSAWGKTCLATAARERRMRRLGADHATPDATPEPDATGHATPTVTADSERRIDPETGEVLPDPRVHQEGWRGLAQGRGGIGWQPGHGPDSGRLCCKHLVCYDVLRPMPALLKGVQPGEEIHPRQCWCTGCRPNLIGRVPAQARA